MATAGVDAVLGGLSQWVASGAEWLLSQIGNVLISTTTIDLGADWFRTHYAVMTALAAVVVLPLLLVSTLQAVFRQNAGQLIRAFFVQLPLALLLGVVAIQIVILCLSATDAMCTAVAGGSGSDVNALLAGMTKGLVIAVGDPTMATFVLLLVGLLGRGGRVRAVARAPGAGGRRLCRRALPPVGPGRAGLARGVALVPPSGRDAGSPDPFQVRHCGDAEPGRGRGGVGIAGPARPVGLRLGPGRRRPPRAVHLRPLFHPPPHPDGRSGCHRASRRGPATRHGRRDPRCRARAAQFALSEGMAAHGAAKLAAQAGPPGTGDGTGLGVGGQKVGTGGGLQLVERRADPRR